MSKGADKSVPQAFQIRGLHHHCLATHEEKLKRKEFILCSKSVAAKDVTIQ
ncbi:hypothetical protein [Bifidobacterium sp. ESL0745]|uniref:hypothetical protein n=1 Tax=Bifidobacterium sp. ESL0745 TaxID=2983226 RepID=UPI0023F9CCEC|nr:hypothetical protein [Bifidobacterium sp. ESL0745]MDF7665496.1 hypothetical protein [Bifidobacterium sp. ESL0745]